MINQIRRVTWLPPIQPPSFDPDATQPVTPLPKYVLEAEPEMALKKVAGEKLLAFEKAYQELVAAVAAAYDLDVTYLADFVCLTLAEIAPMVRAELWRRKWR